MLITSADGDSIKDWERCICIIACLLPRNVVGFLQKKIKSGDTLYIATRGAVH